MRKEALWGVFALFGTMVWLTATPARLGAG
jgi:hypothetical protein